MGIINNDINSKENLNAQYKFFVLWIHITHPSISRIIILLSFLLLQGCNDPLEKIINSNFPPVDIEMYRQIAINSNADALSFLENPNMAFSITFSDAEKIILTNFKKIGVKEFNISGDTQILKIKVLFDKQFNEKDALDNPELSKKLSILRPHIIGEITIFAGITGGITMFDTANPTLEMKILPVLSTVNVTKVKLAEKYDITIAGKLVANLLDKYKNNISGIISGTKLTSVEIPAISNEVINIKNGFNFNNPKLEVILSAQPIYAPFKLDGLAWLITDKQLTSVVQISPTTKASTATNIITIEHSFYGIKKRIKEIVDQVLEIPDAESHTWVAIKKDIIALSMNNLLKQASVCLMAKGEVFSQHLETKVAMPDGSGIRCETNRSCDPNMTCVFSANKDERDCSACLLRTPRICTPFGCIGGQCSIRGQDPTCQAQKEAQQVLYNLDANARKADCDRLRETKRLTCQTEVIAEKALCEAKKSTLDALGKTGNFANLDVDANLKTTGMKVCIKNFTMSSSLDNVQFSVEVLGSANAHVDLRFMPLDAGHLVCPIKWQKELDLNAELAEKIISNSIVVKFKNENTGLSANFTTDIINLNAKIIPSPTELLLRNPDLFVKCPVIQFVAPVIIVLTPFIPQLRGDFNVSLPAQKASFPIPAYTQKIGNITLSVKTDITPTSIVHSARIN